jgi:hypothetical protein
MNMSRFAQLVALSVLAGASANTLRAHLLFFQPAPVERPAGCHEHGGKAPPPLPVSSQCCLIGHDNAVTEATHSPEPVLHDIREVVVEDSIVPLVSGSEMPFLSSGDPPGLTALRI